jgi:hypothetical protein
MNNIYKDVHREAAKVNVNRSKQWDKCNRNLTDIGVPHAQREFQSRAV